MDDLKGSGSALVAAVEGPRIQDDLLGDDLLADHGLGTSHEDRRGVGEVLADMVEYATSWSSPSVLTLRASSSSARSRVLRRA